MIVVVPSPVVAGAIVRVRPVGALLMKDEAGDDEKVIAVPVDKLHPFYSGVKSYKDLPVTLIDQIAHFFQHYKDLEKGKWVTIVSWSPHSGLWPLASPSWGSSRPKLRGCLLWSRMTSR